MFPTRNDFFVFILLVMIVHIYIVFYHGHAVRELPDWPLNSVRNISRYINPEVKNFPNHLCRYNTSLLVVVFSSPPNTAARNAIRATWGNKTVLARHNISLFFLLGQSRNSTPTGAIEEDIQHKDIIIEDFVDSYSNLTLKCVTMLKLFKHGHNCKYLLKTDDDVYVNLPPLAILLKKRKSDEGLLTGRVIRAEKRKNNYFQKWYSPKYMYLRHQYPPFLAGPAYLMSLDVAEKLYEAAFRLPLFHLEDVFLTGICATWAKIRLVNNKGFTDYGVPCSTCKLWRLFTAHSFTPEKLIWLHKKMKVIPKGCKAKEPNGTKAWLQHFDIENTFDYYL